MSAAVDAALAKLAQAPRSDRVRTLRVVAGELFNVVSHHEQQHVANQLLTAATRLLDDYPESILRNVISNAGRRPAADITAEGNGALQDPGHGLHRDDYRHDDGSHLTTDRAGEGLDVADQAVDDHDVVRGRAIERDLAGLETVEDKTSDTTIASPSNAPPRGTHSGGHTRKTSGRGKPSSRPVLTDTAMAIGRGVFGVARSVFAHPIFAREDFTEVQAWIWLIGAAAWTPHRRRFGNYVIDLERGQLVGSVRYMAERWGWSKSKVQRFLCRLKTETMIGTDDETGVNIIIICNYDKYQVVGLPNGTDEGTGNGTDAGQTRDTCGTVVGQRIRRGRRKSSEEREDQELSSETPPEKRDFKQPLNKELPIGDRDIKHDGLNGTAMLKALRKPKLLKDWKVDEEFRSWYSQYPRHEAPADAQRAYRRIVDGKIATADDLMSGTLRYAEARTGQDPKYTKLPATWLNKGCWADEPASQNQRSCHDRPPNERLTGTASALKGILDALQEKDEPS